MSSKNKGGTLSSPMNNNLVSPTSGVQLVHCIRGITENDLSLKQRLANATSALNLLKENIISSAMVAQSFDNMLAMLMEPLCNSASSDHVGGCYNNRRFHLFTRELQNAIVEIMQRLGAIKPKRYIDWIYQHTVLLVDVGVSQRSILLSSLVNFLKISRENIPKLSINIGLESDNRFSVSSPLNERTTEFLEYDAALTSLSYLLSTLLNMLQQDDTQLLVPILECLLYFCDEEFHQDSSRLHPHFVGVADVLVGWCTNPHVNQSIREKIYDVLFMFQPLWKENTVFSMQLLSTFSEDIRSFEESNVNTAFQLKLGDRHKLSSIVVCFMAVASSLPSLALFSNKFSSNSILKYVLRSLVVSKDSFLLPSAAIRCAKSIVEIAVMVQKNDPSACQSNLFTEYLFLSVQFQLFQLCRHSDNKYSNQEAFCLLNGCITLIDILQKSLTASELANISVQILSLRLHSKQKPFHAMLQLYHKNVLVHSLTKIYLSLIQFGGGQTIKVVVFDISECISCIRSSCYRRSNAIKQQQHSSSSKHMKHSSNEEIISPSLNHSLVVDNEANSFCTFVAFSAICVKLALECRQERFPTITIDEVNGMLSILCGCVPYDIPSPQPMTYAILQCLNTMIRSIYIKSKKNTVIAACNDKLLWNLLCLMVRSVNVTPQKHIELGMKLLQTILKSTGALSNWEHKQQHNDVMELLINKLKHLEQHLNAPNRCQIVVLVRYVVACCEETLLGPVSGFLLKYATTGLFENTPCDDDAIRIIGQLASIASSCIIKTRKQSYSSKCSTENNNRMMMAPFQIPSFWRRQLFIFPGSTLLTSFYFESFLNFLMSRAKGVDQENLLSPPGWIDDMVLRSSNLSYNHSSELLSLPIWEKFCQSPSYLPVFWGAWASAQYCVNRRLRTHFGGAGQTFVALEKMIQSFLLNNQDKKVTQLIKPRLLLEFVMALEKNISNACNGIYQQQSHLNSRSKGTNNESGDNNIAKQTVLSSLESASRYITHSIPALEGTMSTSNLSVPYTSNSSNTGANSVRNFFLTNRKVCEDWLSRIRKSLFDLSRVCQVGSLIIYHGSMRVVDIQRKISRIASSSSTSNTGHEMASLIVELDESLFVICCALVELRDSDSIRGFSVWSTSLLTQVNGKVPIRLSMESVSSPSSKIRFVWLHALMYESQGRYEESCKEYELLLDDLNRINGSVQVLLDWKLSRDSFYGILHRCIKCYVALHDWSSCQHWVDKIHLLQQRVKSDLEAKEIKNINEYHQSHPLSWLAEFGQLNVSVYFQEQLIKAAAHFDVMEFEEVETALKKWDSLQKPMNQNSPDECTDILSVEEVLLRKISQYQSQANGGCISGPILTRKLQDELALKLIDGTFDVVQSQMSKIQCLTAIESMKSRVALPRIPLSDELVKFQLDPFVHDVGVWNRKFLVYDSILSSSEREGYPDFSCLKYHWLVARLARKQLNFSLANKFLQKKRVFHVSGGNGIGRLAYLIHGYEEAQLLHGQGETQSALSNLWIMVDRLLSNKTDEIYDQNTLFREEEAKLNVKILCRFAHWLEIHGNKGSCLDLTFLEKEFQKHDSQQHNQLVGDCLKRATKLSTRSCSKAWLKYSHWCYTTGLRSMESILSKGNQIQLTQEEAYKFDNILMQKHFSDSEKNIILLRFCTFEELDVNANSITLEQSLMSFIDDEESRKQLLALYNEVHGRLLQYHRWATRSYFTYLLLKKAGAEKKDENLIVALRILKLLVKYGPELKTEMDKGLADTPLSAWRNILPQLLARFQHPHPYILDKITLIVQRLADDDPYLLIYPTVVSALEQKEATPTVASVPGSNEKFNLEAVLISLERNRPSLVQKVFVLISELKRISNLWEEEWVELLTKMSEKVNQVKSILSREADRVGKNDSLSKIEKENLGQQKRVTLMKPILVALEKVWSKQKHCVETPHEAKFWQKYSKQVEVALTNFGKSKTVEQAWEPFKRLLKYLQGVIGNCSQYELPVISPQLDAFSLDVEPTVILPGLTTNIDEKGEQANSNAILIRSFVCKVNVLMTKTRPKRLDVRGSDGSQYAYLLKGKEDLHLDERIMQLLSSVNQLLQSDSFCSRHLQARHYSVIPLSKQAGLIQMVPNATALFQVYNSFQQREAESNRFLAASQKTSSPTSVDMKIPSPTSLFYSTLAHHLTVIGQKDLCSPDQRPKWPHSVLKRVYRDLCQDTPRHFLAQELHRTSPGPMEIHAKIQLFSRSLAVMSLLGYVIGLGDRHLDNILICVDTGEIVHIDYNVCFEKGSRLRVPEVVPFRLTPSLVAALGVTGVEGTFRAAVEHTLRVLKRNRETLITLLEAFVYDPLVDWTDGCDLKSEHEKKQKKRMELNVEFSLFASRVEEQKAIFLADQARLQSNIDTLLAKITSLITTKQLSKVSGLMKQWIGLKTDIQTKRKVIENAEHRIEDCQKTLNENLRPLQASKQQQLSSFIKEIIESVQLPYWTRHCELLHVLEDETRQTMINLANALVSTNLNNNSLTVMWKKLRKMHNENLSKLSLQDVELCEKQRNEFLTRLQQILRNLDVVQFLETYFRTHFQWAEYEKSASVEKSDDCLHYVFPANNTIYSRWFYRLEKIIVSISKSKEEGIQCINSILQQESNSNNLFKRQLALLSVSVPFHQRQLCTLKNVLIGDLSEHQAHIQSAMKSMVNTIFELKFSNAQGQRVLKLMSADWIFQQQQDQQHSSADNIKRYRMHLFGSLVVRDFAHSNKSTLKRLTWEKYSTIEHLQMTLESSSEVESEIWKTHLHAYQWMNVDAIKFLHWQFFSDAVVFCQVNYSAEGSQIVTKILDFVSMAKNFSEADDEFLEHRNELFHKIGTLAVDSPVGQAFNDFNHLMDRVKNIHENLFKDADQNSFYQLRVGLYCFLLNCFCEAVETRDIESIDGRCDIICAIIKEKVMLYYTNEFMSPWLQHFLLPHLHLLMQQSIEKDCQIQVKTSNIEEWQVLSHSLLENSLPSSATSIAVDDVLHRLFVAIQETIMSYDNVWELELQTQLQDQYNTFVSALSQKVDSLNYLNWVVLDLGSAKEDSGIDGRNLYPSGTLRSQYYNHLSKIWSHLTSLQNEWKHNLFPLLRTTTGELNRCCQEFLLTNNTGRNEELYSMQHQLVFHMNKVDQFTQNISELLQFEQSSCTIVCSSPEIFDLSQQIALKRLRSLHLLLQDQTDLEVQKVLDIQKCADSDILACEDEIKKLLLQVHQNDAKLKKAKTHDILTDFHSLRKVAMDLINDQDHGLAAHENPQSILLDSERLVKTLSRRMKLILAGDESADASTNSGIKISQLYKMTLQYSEQVVHIESLLRNFKNILVKFTPNNGLDKVVANKEYVSVAKLAVFEPTGACTETADGPAKPNLSDLSHLRNCLSDIIRLFEFLVNESESTIAEASSSATKSIVFAQMREDITNTYSLLFNMSAMASELINEKEIDPVSQPVDTSELEQSTTVEGVEEDLSVALIEAAQNLRVQDRNIHALRILRRVREKLEGRLLMSSASEGSNKASKLSVVDHASWLIQQATSSDNLAKMYEGWTPWI